MTTIVTRAGKGSPLTHTEVDTNFTNLNTAKLEAGAIALGSAAAPSISFVSDTNTGIFSPGADQVAISTNGTGRLFIDASGNVGVAAAASTWNLGKVLEVSGTKPVALWNPGDGFNALSNIYYNSAYKFNTTGGYGLYYQQNIGNGAHIFATTTATGSADGAATFSETLRITAAGNVGIGTTSPGAILHVFGSGAQSRLENSGATNSTQFLVKNTVGTVTLGLDSSTGGGFGAANAAVLWYDAAQPLVFATNNTERARIDSSGRLLVGTSTDSGSGALLQTPSLQLLPNTTARTINAGLHGHFNSVSVADDATATTIASATYAYFTAILDIAIANGDTMESAATIMVDVRETTVQSTILGGFSTTNFDVVQGKTGTDAKFNICLNGVASDSYLAFRNRMGGTRRVSILYRIIHQM